MISVQDKQHNSIPKPFECQQWFFAHSCRAASYETRDTKKPKYWTISKIPLDPCMVYSPTFTINTYIYHKNQPNVGVYTIHGSYGDDSWDTIGLLWNHICKTPQEFLILSERASIGTTSHNSFHPDKPLKASLVEERAMKKLWLTAKWRVRLLREIH